MPRPSNSAPHAVNASPSAQPRQNDQLSTDPDTPNHPRFHPVRRRPTLRGATLHDLRHFYASVLTKNGATPKQVQMKLGHSKPSITLNVCTHLREAEEDRTASMMEAALS
ncbi:tyrosine-type recombinase/integrase [Streptomyces sp. DT193]|uniref:tyrosine-type recombinase/integrase n=1 Tax=Streptomyces sp. DT193 TaxID=3393418 RepID=UPI003CE786D8